MHFYTYLWLRENGTPYYVGKSHDGKNSRAFCNSGHHVRKPSEISRIVVQHYESEAEAFEAEKFLIMFYGRANLGLGCLRNLTDGGEGTIGAIRTEEWKRNISLGQVGKKKTYPPYPRTEKHRQQLRERQKGNRVAIGHGRPKGAHSAEEIAKRAISIQAWWNRRRGVTTG